ncbi:MAG: tail fiber domain-containing protein [Saprospiraceae bacterium]|nr:tail fiber domain-containing protein [Saprospiraceae bacterium]
MKGNDSKFGVYGVVTDNSETSMKFGVFGQAVAQTNSWAGYFDGNVGYTGTLSMVSDRRLKKDITDLEDALAKVMALEPKTYSFRQDEYPHLNLAQGQQIGFISQDVEAILPELTHDYMASTPNQDNPKQSSKTPIKGMDYISMIPVLTGAIQEQQEIIEEKEARILTLEQQLADMNDLLTRLVDHVDLPQEPVEENITLTDAELGQNQPNPSTEQTAIPFRIPEHVGQAIIRITSTNGQVIYESEIGHRGPGLWKVNTKNLSPATYQYSLILDGQIIGTRRMVIQK